jgi:hypothetical protein
MKADGNMMESVIIPDEQLGIIVTERTPVECLDIPVRAMRVLMHIPFASCHLHGIFLPPCRTKPATVPGLSATASLVQRLCQKSAFWQSPCVKGAIGQSIFIGGTGNPCEVSTTSNN